MEALDERDLRTALAWSLSCCQGWFGYAGLGLETSRDRDSLASWAALLPCTNPPGEGFFPPVQPELP